MNPNDPYLWLEDLSDKKVIEWAYEQDRIAREYVRAPSERLYERLLKLYEEPFPYAFRVTRAGYIYMVRGRDYRLRIRYRDGEERDIVSSENLGSDAIISWYAARDEGDVIAYYHSSGGRDVGFLDVVDIESGELIDRIEGSVHGIVFLGRDRFYYSRFYRSGKCPDGVGAPCDRVFLRSSGKEEMVFGAGIPTSNFILVKSSSDMGSALITISYGWHRSRIYFGDLLRPEGWTEIYGGDFVSHPIDRVGDCVLIATYDQGGMGRIACISDSRVEEIVGERDEHLSSAAILDNVILAVYTDKDYCYSKIHYYSVKGDLLGRYIPETPSTINLHMDRGFEGEIPVEMTSYVQRYRVLRIGRDLSIGVIAESRRLEDIDIDHGWARSHDGARIHYFIVGKRGSKPSRIVLYGYGGFGISLTPNYYLWSIPLIEDGAALVVANLRGGSELGEKWHREGMREKKINVFMDFIAVAEDLRRRFGDIKIAIHGRSNGGLLVASAITMRPDLFDAAVIGYPVIDLLRFDKLYIGRAWVPEYGDPEDPRDRRYLEEYSPYHRVKPGADYPPVFIYTGLNDDRVHPAHAFKFHARLREYGYESYLRVERSSGHIGSSPEILAREAADYLGFIYTALGLYTRSS
ncbi:MAG: prolyl oligopeptidase family serine peptidase [Sulfolobales archaeon]